MCHPGARDATLTVTLGLICPHAASNSSTASRTKFGDKITGVNLEAIDPWIEVSPDGLVEVCQYLKTEPDLQFDLLNCITVVDYFEPDPKKAAKVDVAAALEVVYHLSSVPHRSTRWCSR